jgi:hypothetical protein
MNFFTILKIVLSLLPSIIQVMKELEGLFPETGQGKVKLGLIKTTLETVYTNSVGAVGSFEQVWPVLETLITKFVALFNSTGLFKK